MSDYQPYTSPSSHYVPPGGGLFANFGNYFSRGFQVYGQTWQSWITPILLAALMMLGGLLCCLVGAWIVSGPVSCGLFACAQQALRGQQVDSSGLGRGWDRFGAALLGWWAPFLLVLIPAILLYSAPLILFMLMVPAAAGPPGHGPGAHGGEAAIVLVMLGICAVWMIGAIGLMIWAFWLTTRTMFILPLIADRDIGFSEAWRTSWEATRHGFWELLLLNFLAGLIAGLGAYACYVGLIFTMPIYYCLVAAAYEHRCAPTAATPDVDPAEMR